MNLLPFTNDGYLNMQSTCELKQFNSSEVFEEYGAIGNTSIPNIAFSIILLDRELFEANKSIANVKITLESVTTTHLKFYFNFTYPLIISTSGLGFDLV